MSVYLFTIISVLSGVRVGLDTFFSFMEPCFFSHLLNLWGVQYSVQLRKALTLRTVLHPRWNTVDPEFELEEDTWLVLGTHFL